MGACTSKSNVLNGEAPEVVPKNLAANDVGLVVNEEVVNKDETLIVEDGDSDKNPSLDNLLNNQEEKGSKEDKEETSVKAFEVASEEDKIELEYGKVVGDSPKTDASNCVDEKKIENVKSKTHVGKNAENVVKLLVERENKTDDQEKLPEIAPTVKTVEEVKLIVTEDKKIEEKTTTAAEDLNFEAEKKKTEDKPAATKKGKFWWDK